MRKPITPVSLKMCKAVVLLFLSPLLVVAQEQEPQEAQSDQAQPGENLAGEDQSEETEPLELSLDEAIERVLTSSSSLIGASAAVEAATAREAQARTGRYPSVRLEGSYMRLKEQDPATIELPPPPQGPGPVTLGESVANSYAATLSVRQPLFTGGEIDARIAAAERATAASTASRRWRELGVELEVRRAYWALLETQLRVEALSERVRQVEENLANMERRRENGVVTRSEVLKVRMKLGEVQLQLLRGENARELARTRLALLTDLPPESDLVPVTPLPEVAPERAHGTAGPDELLDGALRDRPDLMVYRERVEAAMARERGAEAGWYPQLFLAGEYSYARPNQAIFPPEDQFESSWRIGVVGRIELGAMPRVYHEGRESRAEVKAAVAALASAEQNVRLSVREAILTYENRGEEIALAETMVQQAEENVAETRARVANGVALNEELLEAQATLLEVRLSLTSARIGRQVAWEQLLRETGREL